MFHLKQWLNHIAWIVCFSPKKCVKWLNGGQVFITNSIGGLLFNREMALVAQFQVRVKDHLVAYEIAISARAKDADGSS